MKKLYLLRHAKATRDDATRTDRDRPLAARGEHDAARMGQRWLQRHRKPDLIVSSPALRALTTARIFADSVGCTPADIVVDDRIYAASMDALIAFVEQLDDTSKRVLLVGHNPGFTDLAHHFSRTITHMPTCSIAGFEFDVDHWADVGRARPVETAFDAPA